MQPCHDALDGGLRQSGRRNRAQRAVSFTVVGKMFSSDTVGGGLVFTEFVNADVFDDIQQTLREVVNALSS